MLFEIRKSLDNIEKSAFSRLFAMAGAQRLENLSNIVFTRFCKDFDYFITTF